MVNWKSSLRGDPTEWLLDFGSPPIRYRVLTELLDKSDDDDEVKKAKDEASSYSPALKIARAQRKDGSFGKKMHSSSKTEWEKTMECYLSMLCEYGWRKESKEIKRAAQTLKQFLLIRKEVNFYEFKSHIKGDELRQQYYRSFLRIFALAMLSRSGFNEETKVRGGVLETLEYVSAFVSDPIAKDPIEKTGAAYPIIRKEAYRSGFPYIPDYYTLLLFAYNPWLLDGEFAKINLKKIFDYMISDTYQNLGPSIGLVKTVKGYFTRGLGIELKSVDYYLKRGILDYMIIVLEMFARLGLINRYPMLMNNMEWIMNQQQRDGRWNIDISYFQPSSKWSHYLRLEKDWKSPNRKISDLTFRIILLLKNQWVRQIKMLDRYEDTFPI